MSFMTAARRMFQPLWKHTIVLIVLLPMSLAPSMFGQDFSGMVVFGTSLSDPGNHFIEFGTTALQPFAPLPDASYAIGGHHFTNGATWVEQVATSLHLPTSGNPALRKGGVFGNYAMGRARVRPCATVPAACPDGQYPFGVVEVGFEVSHFLSDVGGDAPAGYLYVIEVGGNDVNDALAALYTDPTFATSVAIITAAVTAEAAHLQSLYHAGARTFLITSAPNFALTPYVRALGPNAQFAAASLATAYDGALNASVLTPLSGLPGIRFIHFDFNSILTQIEAQPADFGITNAMDSCLNFGGIGDSTCSTPKRYLFWDGVHPTTTAHSLVAAGALQALSH
jgi:phospholipase/lecithinase/hemolysin